jgi:hypothetical protein
LVLAERFYREAVRPLLGAEFPGLSHSAALIGRDRALGEAYAVVAQMHNARAVSDPQPTEVEQFFGRPFSVIFGERFAKALVARIEDPSVRQIPLLIGGVDQWSDSTDVLETATLRARLRVRYQSAD